MASIHPNTLKFLSSLKKNNNKEWFEKNRSTYEDIKKSLLVVTTDIIKEMSRFDPSVNGVDPKTCLFRINRDVRFSADKSPYKTSMGIAISKEGKNFPGAGYYIHLEPGECFFGGGSWMPMPDQLNKIRQEIDYNYKAFQKLVESPSFKKTFGKLSDESKLRRPPKNYNPDHPAIEYLKLKSFTCGSKFSDADALSDQLHKKAATAFKEMYPFIRFLNQAMA